MYRKKTWTGIFAAVGLVILILDAKTALLGAQEGIRLCINTVIPSLFPFFILSGIISGSLRGQSFRPLRPLGKLCGIPDGGEALLVLGFLGGYPVGAQGIADACVSGCLDDKSAKRMLGFCSNAGPAFIFGMLGGLFSSKAAIWLLWGVHILSAILVGSILPEKTEGRCRLQGGNQSTISTALDTGIKAMARVCGWVIMFRVILAFCQNWFLWLFSCELSVTIAGLLELSNGCIGLYQLESEGLRFILGACFLSFGGLCVAMQTLSVTKKTGTGWYFPGKVLQLLFTLPLAYIAQSLIFQADKALYIPAWPLLLLPGAASILYFARKKKVVAILG